VTENRAFRGNDEIADGCQVEAAPQGDPSHGRNDRLAEGEDLLQVARDEAEVIVDLLVAEGRHFLEVHPGREEVVASREDDGTYGIVGFEHREAIDEFGLHLPGKGVHLVRAIEHDDGIAVLPCDADGLIVHNRLTLKAGLVCAGGSGGADRLDRMNARSGRQAAGG